MVIKQTILETPPNLLRNTQNLRRSLQTDFPEESSTFFEDPQNFLRIVILRIF